MMDDAALRELLGAYALDACDDGEVAAVEALLARDPDARREADELRNVASLLGATQAARPSPGLRDAVLSRAWRVRPSAAGDDPALDLYAAQTERFDALVDALNPDDLEVETFNGLTVHELVVHMAAMESAFAASAGAPTIPELTTVDVEARTRDLIAQLGGRPVSDAHDLWRRSVDVLRVWAAGASGRLEVPGVGFSMSRHSALAARAFETWTHDDDIRRAIGLPLVVPPAEHLHVMADTSARSLPLALAFTGRTRPGKKATIELTGDGGGTWTVPLDMSVERPVDGPDVAADVYVRVDVVDWCRLASERLEPAAVQFEASGDVSLVEDLFAAAPAFATL
ncbi:MAG: maleylpyruvate isomerase family mycothiol-dependent enzyme [Actinobacteria bacterium]|nr:maleylpyruvate isomerase family mycothiol-dependent enzyme [Actinomycetota bacterium]